MYTKDGASLRCFLFKCSEDKRKIFKSSTAALLVSVGNPSLEGEKLWAMVNFINKSFKKCSIMVNDSLQKYTIALNECDNFCLDEAYKKSIQRGKEWVGRNSLFLNSLVIPSKIHYWNEWLGLQEYTFYRSKIDYLYKNDVEFKNSMHATIQEFITRNQGGISRVGLERFYSFCLQYLLEECAVIMGVWQNCEYDFILYPGKIIDILKYTHSSLVCSKMLYWLHIKFRRNNKRLYKEKMGKLYGKEQY